MLYNASLPGFMIAYKFWRIITGQWSDHDITHKNPTPLPKEKACEVAQRWARRSHKYIQKASSQGPQIELQKSLMKN